MKEIIENIEDEMLAEYDFSNGVRGKYAGRLAEANGYIKLDPAISKAFNSPEEINQLLLAIISSSPFQSQRVVSQ